MSDALDHVLLAAGALSTAETDATRLTGNGTVRADLGREDRKGIPEVILADRKRRDDTLAAVQAFLDGRGRAIVSRTPPELVEELRATHADCRVTVYARSGMVLLERPDSPRPAGGGRVGILTAGTSDVPVAEEAQVVAEAMGCEVVSFYDVGVAGIHRLAEPLAELRRRQVDAVIVAAGMDGALPSVVTGLLDVPVIGLPTPVGYGLGGGGVAALMTMLQSCAPGLTVVNIGNGVGAGATAALIANRVAAARAATPPTP